jgi:hypothetical protein
LSFDLTAGFVGLFREALVLVSVWLLVNALQEGWFCFGELFFLFDAILK